MHYYWQVGLILHVKYRLQPLAFLLGVAFFCSLFALLVQLSPWLHLFAVVCSCLCPHQVWMLLFCHLSPPYLEASFLDHDCRLVPFLGLFSHRFLCPLQYASCCSIQGSYHLIPFLPSNWKLISGRLGSWYPFFFWFASCSSFLLASSSLFFLSSSFFFFSSSSLWN